MRFYAAVAWRTFRRYSTYRAAMAAGVFTQTVFGFILAYAYLALWDARPQLGGYDTSEAVTYVWLGQFLLVVVIIFGGGAERELAERIRDGDVAVDLYRPINLQLWWLAADTGRAGLFLLARGILPVLVGSVVFQLRFPASAWTWLWFAISITLGLLVSFAIRYLVALVAFWLLDARGVENLAGALATFFSGMTLPLTVFPGWLGGLATVLPWSSMVQVPADVLLEKRVGLELVQALGFQAFWAVALLAAGQLLTWTATRKVVVQGG